MSTSIESRPSIESIKANCSIDPITNCWLWLGACCSQNHYPELRTGGYVHIFVWELSRGCQVPKGKTVHHACFDEKCANPDHLMAVTPSRHMELHRAHRWATETTCSHGHDWSANTRITVTGTRICTACQRERYLGLLGPKSPRQIEELPLFLRTEVIPTCKNAGLIFDQIAARVMASAVASV